MKTRSVILQPTPRRRQRGGMTLLEVILALTIFTTAAVALVTALNTIGLATLEARKIRSVEQGLEGIIDEESKNPRIAEIEKDIKAGADGVAYHVRISPVNNITTQQGTQLNGLFRVVVSAHWKEDGHPHEHGSRNHALRRHVHARAMIPG